MRVLPLRGVLLPRRDIRVELLLLIRRQDRAHRRKLLLACLLHLRAKRLHLRARRSSIPALASRAGVFHRLLELIVRLVVLAQLLEASLLIRGQANALEQLPTGTTPTHPALALLLPLRLLSRLCRGNANGAESQGQTEGRGN